LGRFCPVGARRAPAAPAHPCARGICESFHIRAQPGAVKRALSERVARAARSRELRSARLREERREPRVFRAASDRGAFLWVLSCRDKKVPRPRCTRMCKCRGRQDAGSDRGEARTLQTRPMVGYAAAPLTHPTSIFEIPSSNFQNRRALTAHR